MRTPAGRDDGGFTLIEMLIVVMLLGLGFVAVLGGMATSMIASTLHRDQAQAETEVRRYAEVMKAQPYACSYGTVFTPTATGPNGAPYTAAAPVVVGFLDAAGGAASCGATPTPTQVVQVSVTSADGKATETIRVLKRPST